MRISPINNYQGVNGVNGISSVKASYPERKIIQNSLSQNTTDSFQRVAFQAKPRLTPEQIEQITDLKVFNHHVYEFKKGIRTLILTTEKSKHKEVIEERLKHENIDYVIHDIDDKKINVFFGEKPCVEVVKTLNPKLSEHTPQEDFMLGILLGYDKVKQCVRYLNFRERAKQKWTQ